MTRVAYSAESLLGGRATQQDMALELPFACSLESKSAVHVFGVFDGHGTIC